MTSAAALPFIDLSLPHPCAAAPQRMATLGPAGTSSERAARHLAEYLSVGWPGEERTPRHAVALFDRYELAAASVLDGDSSLLIVANAYHDISDFYMSPQLIIRGVFCMNTPQYGIAAKNGQVPHGTITVASHPAPVPLIPQLLSSGQARNVTVVEYDSTSAAARAAAEGSVDVALTTVPAAEAYDLVVVTGTRDIRMVWSVFGAGEPDAANPAVTQP